MPSETVTVPRALNRIKGTMQRSYLTSTINRALCLPHPRRFWSHMPILGELSEGKARRRRDPTFPHQSMPPYFQTITSGTD